MLRRPAALVALCTAFAALLWAQPALAKPKVAVLGLEVTGQGATDRNSIEAAKSLTRELRREATRPTGPFELAPNSQKDLLEIKMLSDCSDEGRRCMSEVGKQMKADRLVYGKLDRQKDGYQVSLKMLNTETAELESEATTVIAFKNVGVAGGLQREARSLYRQISGAPSDGAVAITANAERGTVYVDGEVSTTLSAGAARLSGLSEGTHTISIEADGFARYQSDVKVQGGEEVTLRANLVALGDGGEIDDGDERPGKAWRVAFWSGVVVTGLSGAAWTYSGLQVFKANGDVDDASALYRGPALPGLDEGDPSDPTDNTYPDACNSYSQAPGGLSAQDQRLVDDVLSACDRGERYRNLVNRVFIPATVAAALFSTFAYYKGYIAPKKSTRAERTAGKRKASEPTVTFSPAVGPDLVGAGLEITF